jgi:putative phosphoribosyl transferase
VPRETPEPFWAIGAWYSDFSPTVDREVIDILHEAGKARAAADRRSEAHMPAAYDGEVEVRAGAHVLPGRLTVPTGASGVWCSLTAAGAAATVRATASSPMRCIEADWAHCSSISLTRGGGRPRQRLRHSLLAERLATATDWLRSQPATRELAVGYFGASTGAGAALWAAAAPGSPVRAVVSRGGRPDLARQRLREVRAPTLLIVGGRDDVVIELNQEAASHLRCEHRLEIVPGATHLFEEPGTLEVVAELACRWFVDHCAT